MTCKNLNAHYDEIRNNDKRTQITNYCDRVVILNPIPSELNHDWHEIIAVKDENIKFIKTPKNKFFLDTEILQDYLNERPRFYTNIENWEYFEDGLDYDNSDYKQFEPYIEISDDGMSYKTSQCPPDDLDVYARKRSEFHNDLMFKFGKKEVN